MVTKIKNSLFRATLVLRHRWESRDKRDYTVYKLRKEYRLGLWYKPYKAVGKADGPLKSLFSEKNLVRGYMIGADLLVCRAWIDITSPKILTLKTEDNEIQRQ
jgi:hypothetical protein